MEVIFFSLFLGGVEKLLSIMEKSFPELRLRKEDCLEMSWVESTALPLSLFLNEVPLEDLCLEDLLDRTPLTSGGFKIKSDFAIEPIPEIAIEGIWERFKSGETEVVQLALVPYGGKMSKIPAKKTSSPHRVGYKFKIAYYVTWQRPNVDSRHLEWS